MLGLNLLVLQCKDVEAAGRFYGCSGINFDRHRHGDGPDHLGAEDVAGVLQLYPLASGRTADTAGLAVADRSATSAAMATAGFAPGAIVDRPWGRTFVVRDSDGRPVEVKQA